MTDETSSSRLGPVIDGGGYPPVPVHEAPSPLVPVLGALRGRYAWALGIGIVLAGLGGAAGFLLPRPLYKSVGMIEIAPTVPRILFHTEEKGVLPMFEAYVAAQGAVITSRRVVDLAMSSPEWRKFGRGLADAEIAAFQGSLGCENPKRSQFLAVSFTDEDPDAATVAVNQVIKAYMKIVEEREREGGASRYQVLLTQQTTLANRLASLRADVLAATDGLGVGAVRRRYEHLVEQINKDDALIHELDLEIATARDSGLQSSQDAGRDPTPEELAVHDDVLNGLLLSELGQKNDVEFLVVREGKGAAHPDVVNATRALEQTRLRISERAQRILQSRAAGGAPILAVQSIQEKERRRERILAMRESARDEAKAMSGKLAEVANLEAEQSMANNDLDQVKRRVSQIDVESEIQGRISVMNRGSRPVQPDTDRRAALAVLGGGGGLALGFAAVVLWGLRNARIRHIADVGADAARDRFLGILPDLDGGEDEEPEDERAATSAQMADYCVHHVRTMLQLGHASPGRVVAFTSPSPGSGKTTLGYSIACSFGASGARTLLIDCDLIGHGLTSSLADVTCGVARDVLGGDGVPPVAEGTREDSIVKIVEHRRSGLARRELGTLRAECLRRGASLDPAEDRVVRAVESMARYAGDGAPGATRRRGLLDALTGTPLDECVVATCFANVSVLPVGDATPRDAERLSPASLDRLLASCRTRFDVILVDTGPILGSLEAAFVTVKADDVVLVVSRGDMKNVVDSAMKRLENAGARVAGVVFNRARPEDAARSTHVSRSSSATAAETE